MGDSDERLDGRLHTAMPNFITELEHRELIQKLIDGGHGELVDVLLSNAPKVYTKRGKINKSGTCRALGWKIHQLEAALMECRQLLWNDCVSN